MVGLTKITPIKKKDPITVNINEQDIIIKQYLSIKDKADLITYVVQSSFNENGSLNPLREKIYTVIGILKWYTNINFTDTMLKEIEKTYDLIILNNIYSQVINNIDEIEIEIIKCWIIEAINSTFTHINSFAGQLQYAKTDYQNLNFDMKEMEKTLQDPNQIGFLKEVMEKMG